MRGNDGRGFESHATAEKYSGHLISAPTPSTATTGEIPVNQAGDLGMLLQTEDHYTKHSNFFLKEKIALPIWLSSTASNYN
jgi:hypothetical protein